MDMFVVVVSVVAIVIMLSAACWVLELAPDLSGKLGVSQQLLVRTVLSKLARTLSHRFPATEAAAKELQLADAEPTAPADVAMSNTPPHRRGQALHLPILPLEPRQSPRADCQSV
jgi:hypothetical protein